MFLLVCSVLIATGFLLVFGTRNALVLLMGVELLIGAATVLIVAGADLQAQNIAGQTFALIVLFSAATQATLIFALILNLYKKYRTIDLDDLNRLGEPEAKNRT